MTEQRTDYDSPWKDVIESFFPRFLEFFFPQAYAVIDWERGYEFLDTELQQLEPDAEIGKRLVDKVAKVWLLDGEEAWVLVHVEVQGQYDTEFGQRMYTYNYRLFDRHKKQVISLAVLADEEASWRPSSYGYLLGGCRVSLEFPVAKLLDYEAQWETLEQSTNPFSVVVMAHLKTKATHRNPESRLHWKLSLVRRLFERGYSRENILGLFRFIDWIMVLPEELARSFKQELRNDEEADRMRYVTSIERLAKEEGIEQGMLLTNREHVIKILQTRFGVVPEPVVESINGIENLSVLKMLFTTAITIGSIEEFQQVLNERISEGEL
ncbi:transposase [Brasilonema sp. UFV-L1]|uniref:transposase n=1 Tax=Brasilonema sp. UFV-L1 TaxID=2234130 RepID=UPI00145E10A2|nr:transposase [Brasilonema sp. UFV-L1]NMG06276.1 transposase [Brasilonema sp. UFV-L1]